jgi:DUF177 domain-containing protein
LLTGQDVLLKIRVTDITEKEKLLSGEEEISSLPTLLQTQSDGECEFLSPISYSLSVVKEYDHIRVQGKVGTDVKLVCSRCLTEFTGPLSSTFTIFYTKSEEAQPQEEVELGEEDLISVTYSGDELDFSGEIAEQILLGLPFKPLCSEDCNGLCPNCGADLNTTTCNCSEKNVSMAFSPLKGLKVKQ